MSTDQEDLAANDDDSGNAERACFDAAAAAELRTGYEIEAPAADDANATQFVRDIERTASGIATMHAAALPPQRERKRGMEKVALALFHLHEEVQALDENARGWLLAQLVAEAEQRSPDEISPMLAQANAELMQQDVLVILESLALAAQRAANTMPQPHRPTRIELLAAQGLLMVFSWHRLPWETSETGFAAQCLDAMLRLLGEPVAEGKRLRYWLEQAEANPRST